MMFHAHHWREVGRRFTPPFPVDQMRGGSEEHQRRVLFGFTSVEQCCVRCGTVRFIETDGNQTGGKP